MILILINIKNKYIFFFSLIDVFLMCVSDGIWLKTNNVLFFIIVYLFQKLISRYIISTLFIMPNQRKQI